MALRAPLLPLSRAAAAPATTASTSASATRPYGAVLPARRNPLRRRACAAARPRAAPLAAAAAPLAVASALHDVLDATTTTALDWVGSSPVGMDISPLLTMGAIGDDVAMGLFTAAQSADSLVAGQLSGSVTPATFVVTLLAGPYPERLLILYW